MSRESPCGMNEIILGSGIMGDGMGQDGTGRDGDILVNNFMIFCDFQPFAFSVFKLFSKS